jgi:hypothetical protein
MLTHPKSAAAPRAESGQRDDVAPLSDACTVSRSGGNAYLDVKALYRVWNGLVRLSREALASRYATAVPDRSFESSCIFHLAQGCSLPSAMRSHIGLDYYEPGRAALSASDQLGT